MKLEDNDKVRQIGLFKDHQEPVKGPLMELKLAEHIQNPTHTAARTLQRRLNNHGWEFYTAVKRDGYLYVTFEGAV